MSVSSQATVTDGEEFGVLRLELLVPFPVDGGSAAEVIESAKPLLLQELDDLKDDEALMAAISRLRGGYER